MYFTNYTINTCTFETYQLKMFQKHCQVNFTRWTLKIPSIVPFTNRVFNFANSAEIAMYFHDSIVIFCEMMMVFVVSQYSFLSWISEIRFEPFNWIEFEQTLHTAEIYWNFNCVLFTDLGDWLNAWSFHELLNKQIFFCADWICTVTLVLTFLELRLCFVLVNPNQPRILFADNIHFKISAMFLFFISLGF